MIAFTAIVVPGAIPVIRAFGWVTIILFVAVLAIAAGPRDDAFTSSPHATTYPVTPFSGLGVHVSVSGLSVELRDLKVRQPRRARRQQHQRRGRRLADLGDQLVVLVSSRSCGWW